MWIIYVIQALSPQMWILMFIVRVKLRPVFEANKSHGNSSASLTTLAQIHFTPSAIISFNVLNIFFKLTLFV